MKQNATYILKIFTVKITTTLLNLALKTVLDHIDSKDGNYTESKEDMLTYDSEYEDETNDYILTEEFNDFEIDTKNLDLAAKKGNKKASNFSFDLFQQYALAQIALSILSHNGFLHLHFLKF